MYITNPYRSRSLNVQRDVLQPDPLLAMRLEFEVILKFDGRLGSNANFEAYGGFVIQSNDFLLSGNLIIVFPSAHRYGQLRLVDTSIK